MLGTFLPIHSFSDEVTSALDATSRAVVFEVIKPWCKNNTTTVTIHNLFQITLNDFVYVLKVR